MFYIYWILMMIALFTSFAYFSKGNQNKNHSLIISGMVQCLLTLALPLLNFLFVAEGRWMNSFENEFIFLWQKLHEGNMIAFATLFGYLALFALVILNGRWSVEEKNRSSISI